LSSFVVFLSPHVLTSSTLVIVISPLVDPWSLAPSASLFVIISSSLVSATLSLTTIVSLMFIVVLSFVVVASLLVVISLLFVITLLSFVATLSFFCSQVQATHPPMPLAIDASLLTLFLEL
jgi:hypothetical protein